VLRVLCDYLLEHEVLIDLLPLKHDWPSVAFRQTEWEAMEGETIKSIVAQESGKESFLQIETEAGVYRWVSEGDCCAQAYLHDLPDEKALKSFIGQKIVRWEVGDVTIQTDSPGYEQLDVQFYTLHAGREMLQLELRTEHNGYYGGWLQLKSSPECHWIVGR